MAEFHLVECRPTSPTTYITRFSPSTSGGLHLGHIYTALVNQQLAHSSGGKFIVRVDDTHTDSLTGRGLERNARIEGQMRYDMDWLGIAYDTWTRESVLEDFFNQYVESEHIEVHADIDPEHFQAIETHVIGRPDLHPAAYTPWVTAQRVFYDWMQNVNLVVRAEELLAEYGLYCHYCQSWQIQQPQFLYLPRLRAAGGGEISKTKGGYQIAGLRANGYSPRQVLDMLAIGCLIVPLAGWHIWNLKPEPSL
jgi:glutamyl/glutaminyl-tRNA synthetase